LIPDQFDDKPINYSNDHDWAFYANDPKGALGGSLAQWCYWWNERLQKRFAELWGPDADILADELADSYGYIWPWLIDRLLPTRALNSFAHIEHLLSSPEFLARTNGTNPESVLSTSIIWGSFHVVRRRRTWLEPKELTCPICTEVFWGGDLPIWTYRQFGTARYCPRCCIDVRNGKAKKWNQKGVIESIQKLAAAQGSIPSQAFSFEVLAGLPEERRDVVMQALTEMPNLPTVIKVLSARYWLNALQKAGLVGEAWRPSRGTWCFAEDGHRCRSLLEKSIDDWFTKNGLQHECEPTWPMHPVYNPSGKRRADWSLPSGAFVECVGMMSDEDYLRKIKEKQLLAAEVGIKLYLVSSSDMLGLAGIFENEIG